MTNKTFPSQHQFDHTNSRHIVNGRTIAFHCHHFVGLTTRLVLDAEDLNNAPKILLETCEDTFRKVLEDAYEIEGAHTLKEKIEVAESYFSWVGLGNVRFTAVGEHGGEVKIPSSHVDNAWVSKWGTLDRPVNFIGLGYIGAAFASFFDKGARSYKTQEAESIVKGAAESKIIVALN